MQFITNPGTSPLSQAVIANGFVFTAGQVGRDENGQIAANFEGQLTQALRNLEALLQRAGTDLHHVVKLTAFITNDGWSPQFNDIYSRYFQGPYPARTRVEVARLSPGYLVEIDAIAVLPTASLFEEAK